MEPKNNNAMDESQWLDGLRRQAESHTETPPEEWWGDIERRTKLAAADKSVQVSSRRRRVFAWVGSSAAAAVVAAVLLFRIDVDVNAPGDVVAPTIVADVVPATETEPQPDVLPEPILEPTQVSKPAIIAPPKSRPTIAQKPTSAAEPVTEAEPTEPTTPPQAEKPSTEPETEPEPEPKTETPTTNKPTKAAPRNPMPTPFNPLHAKPNRKRWQAGLYASNMPSANSQNGNPTLTPGHLPPTEPEYTDITHRLPLTVGLTVSRGIGGRWNLATGVNYTMLSSQFRTAGPTDYHTRTQVLHNLGIPLSVNYSLWQGRGLSVYLSAGGAVEKSVSGTATLRNIVGGAIQTERRDKISDRFQWSLRGAAGLQYDFSRTMGLYAEPGVNFYFDNRSGIETIYKTKPLNFGLQLGVRLSM